MAAKQRWEHGLRWRSRKPAVRYSEDIDLVQIRAEQAGPVMSALRSALDPWLGVPRWKQTEGRVTFAYRFPSEDVPPIPLRLKVETNTREHFAVHGFKKVPYEVRSRWFEGNCQIPTYDFDELLGTKLRALYQRKKGRDLFDLAAAVASGKTNSMRIIHAFGIYMNHGRHHVTRDDFANNLADKLHDPLFTADISPLLAPGYTWNIQNAAKIVTDDLVRLLPTG